MRVFTRGTVSDSNERAAYGYFARNKDRFNTIVLTSRSKRITLSGITEIQFVGGETGRGSGAKPKTDIRILHSNGTYNISLKKRTFGAWESADSLAGDRVSEKILEYLLDNLNGTVPGSREFDVVSYVDSGRPKYKIVRKGTDTTVKLAYRCSSTDASTVIFGNDILGKGSVISAGFPGSCILRDNIVTISCESIIQSMADVPSNVYPYFTVKSSFYRKARNTYRFPGLRIQAMPRSEIQGSVVFLPEL